FEAFVGRRPTEGLVGGDLGADARPVYTGECELGTTLSSALCPDGPLTTSRADFDVWFRYADTIDKPFVLYLSLLQGGPVQEFKSKAFFPLDGAGWGNTPGEDHNFGFTTEFHLK